MQDVDLTVVYYLFLIVFIVLLIIFNKISKLEDKINSWAKLKKNLPLKKVEETTLKEPVEEKFEEKQNDNHITESKPIPSESGFISKKTNEQNDNQEKGSFEKFFADNILNKVGAVALILGLGFFLKYAFDNNWINEFAQLVIGYLVSIGILVTGIKMQDKQKLSQSLLGVGCAALFLTTYAGYSFYHLIPNALALVLMSVVSIFTIIISMNYNSLAIAFLGLFGGYITPVIMGTSQNLIGFLSYILFLNAILAYVSYKKDWIKLQLTGLFTNLLWLSIFILSNSNELKTLLLPASILIGAIWLVHFIVDNLKNQPETIFAVNRFINPLFTYILLINLIKTPETTGFIAIAFAAIYLATLYKKDFVGYKHNTILGLVFILFSILKLTVGFKTMGCLIAYSTIIVAIGTIRDKDYILNTGVSFLTFSFAKLLFMENVLMFNGISNYKLLQTPRTFCFEAITIVGFGFGYYLDKIKNNNVLAVNILNFLGATSLFTLLTVEINDYFMAISSNSSQISNFDIANIKNLIYIITWSIYSLFFIKISERSEVFKIMGYSIYLLTLLFLLCKGFNAIPSVLAVFNIRVLAWIIFIGVTCLAAKWNKAIKDPFTYIALVLGTMLIYTETTIFLPDMSIKQLILSSSWLIYAIGLISIGIWKNLKPQRYFAIGLISLVIIKIFFFDLTFLAQMHRIISFLVLGGLLLLTSYLYQKYAQYIK